MRQAIGSTWVMQLVIIFMLIFVAFLSLSINYTKAFKIKNELITMIEKYEGLSEGDNGSLKIINNYLLYNNYSTRGYCEANELGITDLQEGTMELAEQGEKYYYCVRKINTSVTGLPNRAKYSIRIFFHFSLPVLGDLFTFSSEGTTIDINKTLEHDIDYT